MQGLRLAPADGACHGVRATAPDLKTCAHSWSDSSPATLSRRLLLLFSPLPDGIPPPPASTFAPHAGVPVLPPGSTSPPSPASRSSARFFISWRSPRPAASLPPVWPPPSASIPEHEQRHKQAHHHRFKVSTRKSFPESVPGQEPLLSDISNTRHPGQRTSTRAARVAGPFGGHVFAKETSPVGLRPLLARRIATVASMSALTRSRTLAMSAGLIQALKSIGKFHAGEKCWARRKMRAPAKTMRWDEMR